MPAAYPSLRDCMEILLRVCDTGFIPFCRGGASSCSRTSFPSRMSYSRDGLITDSMWHSGIDLPSRDPRRRFPSTSAIFNWHPDRLGTKGGHRRPCRLACKTTGTSSSMWQKWVYYDYVLTFIEPVPSPPFPNFLSHV